MNHPGGSRLWRANQRYLRRHRLQGAVAVLGVALGVAIMVAVDLSNASARQAFLLSQAEVNGDVTHHLVAGPGGVDEHDYVALRKRAGTRAMAPVVEGLVTVQGRTLTLLGLDLLAEAGLRQRPATLGMTAADLPSFLRASGHVLMDPGSAGELGLQPGQAFTLEADGRPYRATLVGLVGDKDRGGAAQLMLTDIAAAQEWLNMPGRISRIDLRLADAAEERQIRALLPQSLRLLDGETRRRGMADMAQSFSASLSAMSLLAVLVAVFLIYNSMGFSVVQRRGLLALMRALGVTRSQVVLLMLREGALLALAGVSLGLLLGVALGQLLVDLVVRTINDHYFLLRLSTVTVDGLSLLKGGLVGLAAAAVALALPLAEATSVVPGLAMKRSTLERGARRALPWLSALGAVCILGSIGLLGISRTSLAWGFGALFLAICGAALWVPQAMRAMLWLGAAWIGRFAGSAGRMALRGVAANLSRTGVAVTALAVAVSATVGVELMVSSFRASVGSWLDRTLRADLYVAPPRLAAARSERKLDPQLLQDILALPGIARYSLGRKLDLETDDGTLRLHVLDLPTGEQAWFHLLQGDPRQATRRFLAGDLLVSDPYAFRHGLAPGDSLLLPTPQGPRAFRIAGVYQDYDAEQGVVAMSGDTYRRHWNDPGAASLGLFLVPGVQPAALASQIHGLAAGRQALMVRSDAEIRRLSLEIFDRTFRITDVLYLLTVGIAFVGIFGAMLALQLEQARDLAVLRALGFTPGQLGVMIQLQTSAMGLIAGLLALPLGAAMAWMLIHVVNRRAFGWQIDMQLTAAPMLQALGLAIVAALLAGVYPAWRMARVRPAAAMREE